MLILNKCGLQNRIGLNVSISQLAGCVNALCFVAAKSCLKYSLAKYASECAKPMTHHRLFVLRSILYYSPLSAIGKMYS